MLTRRDAPGSAGYFAQIGRSQRASICRAVARLLKDAARARLIGAFPHRELDRCRNVALLRERRCRRDEGVGCRDECRELIALRHIAHQGRERSNGESTRVQIMKNIDALGKVADGVAAHRVGAGKLKSADMFSLVRE